MLAANRYPGVPDEPGLESEGIGPLGLVIGGATEGVHGVVSAVIGEGIIEHGGNALHHLAPEPATMSGDPNAYGAYVAGVETGRYDTEHLMESPVPDEYEGNESYAKGYRDGTADARGQARP